LTKTDLNTLLFLPLLLLVYVVQNYFNNQMTYKSVEVYELLIYSNFISKDSVKNIKMSDDKLM